MTEIETVTVTFKELKANLDHYVELKETKRVVTVHEGEQIAAWGPWLPGEHRYLAPKWFYDALFPPEPIDPDDPYPMTRALEELRGHRPFT